MMIYLVQSIQIVKKVYLHLETLYIIVGYYLNINKIFFYHCRYSILQEVQRILKILKVESY